MNWVDLTLLGVLFLFGLRGYFKGLFREVFSFAGIVVGFVAAIRYDEPVAALAGFFWDVSPFMLKGAAFVAIFFVTYFLLSLMGWLLHRSERILFLHGLNRVGGVAVGIGKGTGLMAVIVFFASSASWVPRSTRDKVHASYLASPLSQLAEGIIRIGKEKLSPIGKSEAVSEPDRRFA